MATNLLQKLTARAISYVSFRTRSAKEIRDYLVKKTKGKCPEYIPAVEERLRELGYINDNVFAREFVEGRNKNRPMGNKRLFQELLRKGIAPDIIERTVNNAKSEEDLARNIAQKKYSYLHTFSIEVQKRRLFGLLERRGFGYGLISRIIDELLHHTVQ